MSGLFELPVLEPTAVPVDPYPVAGAPAGPSPEDIVPWQQATVVLGDTYHAGARSVVVLIASGKE